MRPLALLVTLAWSGSAAAQDLGYRLPDRFGTPEAISDEPLATRIAPEAADDWFGEDKAKHLGASFGLAVGAHVALREGADMERAAARPLAAGLALGAGLAKELVDERRQRHPLFSWKDLAADALGVALGIAVVSL